MIFIWVIFMNCLKVFLNRKTVLNSALRAWCSSSLLFYSERDVISILCCSASACACVVCAFVCVCACVCVGVPLSLSLEIPWEPAGIRIRVTFQRTLRTKRSWGGGGKTVCGWECVFVCPEGLQWYQPVSQMNPKLRLASVSPSSEQQGLF